MITRSPCCTLAGRWFDGGATGVCLASGHPRCRIPALTCGAPSIPTDTGWLRPERSIVYDNPLLLFHHAAATHPGVVLSKPVIAGFQKTATRLIALLKPYPWANPTPLDWPEPEHILFSTVNDALLYDLIILRRQLQQAESLHLHTLDRTTYLAFQRC